jgi:hypothetical protein
VLKYKKYLFDEDSLSWSYKALLKIIENFCFDLIEVNFDIRINKKA